MNRPTPEVAMALEILSDAGFKLYLCLNADRRTGRMAVPPAELAHGLHGSARAVAASLDELCRCGACARPGGNLLCGQPAETEALMAAMQEKMIVDYDFIPPVMSEAGPRKAAGQTK